MLRWILPLLTLLLVTTASLHAQRRDTVQIIQSSGGEPYLCCYDFLVTNRHSSSTTISEFRVSIISGRARLVPGVSEAPANWAIFQGTSTVAWTANTRAAEGDSNETVVGFHVCVRDTGIFKMVWQTSSSDTILTTDTLSFSCIGKECDEAFVNVVPSNLACAFDLDLVNGNRTGRTINDFHLHMLTPGATFVTLPGVQPARWTRTKAKSDSISFTTIADSLHIGDFAQGFRINVDSPRDSIFRVEWWSTSFGEPICRDTLMLRCSGLTRHDSLSNRRTQGSQDSCCRELTVKNRHLPAGPITSLSLKLTTPGAKLLSAPVPPSGWNVSYFNGDSVVFASNKGLAPDDSVSFRGICFDNHLATTDSTLFRWTTFGLGVAIDQGIGVQVCYRALTRCDSVGGRVDSLLSPTQRCVFLTLGNRNNRTTPIERFVVRISNAGTRRTLLAATAPVGWVATQNSADSVIFTGYLAPGETRSGFGICVSLGDQTSQDPLKIYYRTASSLESICSDTLRLNVNVRKLCDTVAVLTELPSSSNLFCCYRLSLVNRGDNGASRDRIVLSLPSQSLIFADASISGGTPGWTVATQSFPSTDIELVGGTVPPNEQSPTIDFCVDTRFFSGRPADLGLVWRSYGGGQLACYDTVRLSCTAPTAPCDTFAVAVEQGACLADFTLNSRRVPAVPLEQMRFRVVSGSGTISSVEVPNSGFTETHSGSEAMVTGTIPASGQFGTVGLRFSTTGSGVLTVEACTMYAGQTLCCSTYTINCAGDGVTLDPEELRRMFLHDATPNPTRQTAELRYELQAAGLVSLAVRDASGREHRRVDLGREDVGSHAVVLDLSDLPSGIYYCTLTAGGTSMTRPVVVVR